MKDRFKFRVWMPEAKHLRSEAKGGMFYQANQYLYSFIRRVHDQFMVNHPSYLPFELEERMMQCTGLKDENEELIYEGDLVKGLLGDIFTIIWCDDRQGFVYKEKDWDRFNSCGADGLMIIGNIYENPELLTSNKKQNER